MKETKKIKRAKEVDSLLDELLINHEFPYHQKMKKKQDKRW